MKAFEEFEYELLPTDQGTMTMIEEWGKAVSIVSYSSEQDIEEMSDLDGKS